MKGETIFKGRLTKGEERVIELASFRPIGEKKGAWMFFTPLMGKLSFPIPH